MYLKNLTEDLRLRLSKKDMDFLRGLSAERNVSISECIRSIIGDYQRSLEAMKTLQEAIEIVNKGKGGELSHAGDTKAIFDDKL